MNLRTVRYEKRRGFQPPTYVVAVYNCGCGETTLRKPSGPGAVGCPSGKHLLHFDGSITNLL
jgi:hypothetical protein